MTTMMSYFRLLMAFAGRTLGSSCLVFLSGRPLDFHYIERRK